MSGKLLSGLSATVASDGVSRTSVAGVARVGYGAGILGEDRATALLEETRPLHRTNLGYQHGVRTPSHAFRIEQGTHSEIRGGVLVLVTQMNRAIAESRAKIRAVLRARYWLSKTIASVRVRGSPVASTKTYPDGE